MQSGPSNPIVISEEDDPILVPDSPQATPVQDSLLVEIPQIQVMNPMEPMANPNPPFGYEALLTRTSMVQRLTNQPYIPSNALGDTADQGTAENEIF